VQSFADVSPTQPFWLWIERAYTHGTITGYTCGGQGEPCDPQHRPYYRPAHNLTRSQLVKVTALAASYGDPIPSSQQSFSDVPTTNPFWLWIEQVYLHGAISGYPCGTPPAGPCDPAQRPYFLPGAELTRGQAAKIIANVFIPGCYTPSQL
jgi:hypothetical protein